MPRRTDDTNVGVGSYLLSLGFWVPPEAPMTKVSRYFIQASLFVLLRDCNHGRAKRKQHKNRAWDPSGALAKTSPILTVL